MFRKTRSLAAFTLLEALVALLVISGGILVFQAMTQLLASEIRYQQYNQRKAWLLFADQLDNELSRASFEKIEQNRLYVKQNGKAISFAKSKSDDFRKTDANGRGYQPMIDGLKEVKMRRGGQLIYLSFHFYQDLEREYVYRVQEKN